MIVMQIGNCVTCLPELRWSSQPAWLWDFPGALNRKGTDSSSQFASVMYQGRHCLKCPIVMWASPLVSSSGNIPRCNRSTSSPFHLLLLIIIVNFQILRNFEVSKYPSSLSVVSSEYSGRGRGGRGVRLRIPHCITRKICFTTSVMRIAQFVKKNHILYKMYKNT